MNLFSFRRNTVGQSSQKYEPPKSEFMGKPISLANKKSKKERVNRVIADTIDGRKVDDLIGYLKDLVESARKARDKHPSWTDFASSMNDCQQLYIGKHYEVYNKDNGLESLGLTDSGQYVTENHIFAVIKVIAGIWSANRPGFSWKPPIIGSDQPELNFNLVDAAESFTKVFDVKSQKLGIIEWYPDSIINLLQFGHFQAQLHHSFVNGALGEDKYVGLDPLATFCDPNATSWDESKYRGAVVVEEKLKVKAHWENFLGYIGKLKRAISFPNYDNLDTTEAKNWDLKYYNDEHFQDDDGIERGLTYYIEFDDMTRIPSKRKEMVDDKEVEVDDVDEKGEALSTDRKYPNGRLFVIFENDLIFDGNNPYEHGKSQFLYCPGIKVKSNILGIGYPHLFYEMQRDINETVTTIRMNNWNTANPLKVFNETALGKNFVLKNLPNQTIGIKKEWFYQNRPPIEQLTYADNTGQAYNRYIEIKTAMYQIAGIEEAVRGISKSGDSGLKVNNLYENATNRFRPDITQGEFYLLIPYAERLMKNFIQFKVSDVLPIGESWESSVKMVNIYDLLDKFKTNKIELQLILIVGSATPDQRNFELQKVTAIKQMCPNSVPDDTVLIKSDINDIVKIGIQMQALREQQIQNQKMLAQIIPAAAEMLPKLQEIVSTWDDAKNIESLKLGVEAIAQAMALNAQQQMQAQEQTAQK